MSVTYALVGLLIYWVLFPLLAFDGQAGFPAPTLNSTLIYEPMIIIIVFSIAGATTVGIFLSFFGLGFNSVIASSLAGGVISLTCSSYITNPVFAIVIGVFAALFQQVVMQIDEKFISGKFGPIDKLSFVFLVQSILALAFIAWNKAIIMDNKDNLTFSFTNLS